MMEILNKIKKVIDLQLLFWSLIIALLTLHSLWWYVRFSFNENIFDSYKSYYDVLVEIKNEKIDGKLNKFINIRNKNNTCYSPSCGFPSDGTYFLSRIEFYEMDGKYFVFKGCIKKNEHCFHNISKDFIASLKERKSEELKYESKVGLIFFFFFFLTSVILTKVYNDK